MACLSRLPRQYELKKGAQECFVDGDVALAKLQDLVSQSVEIYLELLLHILLEEHMNDDFVKDAH